MPGIPDQRCLGPRERRIEICIRSLRLLSGDVVTVYVKSQSISKVLCLCSDWMWVIGKAPNAKKRERVLGINLEEVQSAFGMIAVIVGWIPKRRWTK